MISGLTFENAAEQVMTPTVKAVCWRMTGKGGKDKESGGGWERTGRIIVVKEKNEEGGGRD